MISATLWTAEGQQVGIDLPFGHNAAHPADHGLDEGAGRIETGVDECDVEGAAQEVLQRHARRRQRVTLRGRGDVVELHEGVKRLRAAAEGGQEVGVEAGTGDEARALDRQHQVVHQVVQRVEEEPAAGPVMPAAAASNPQSRYVSFSTKIGY